MAFRPDRDDEDDDDNYRNKLTTKAGNPQVKLEKLLEAIEELTGRVNTFYNKYFVGADKKPPVKLRDELDKMINEMKELRKEVNVPKLSFKIQSVLGSYVTYKTFWDRKMAIIESSRGK